jgi:hypothetical protein
MECVGALRKLVIIAQSIFNYAIFLVLGQAYNLKMLLNR